MDIRKNLIIIFVLCLMSLPCNAHQFKQWQGIIVNKQAISHIVPDTYKGKPCIEIYYMAGNQISSGAAQTRVFKSTLVYNDNSQRNQALKQMIQWLNFY